MSVQPASTSLEALGLSGVRLHGNLPVDALCRRALDRREAMLTAEGPLASWTMPHTGRSPQDKFVVRDTTTDALVDWGANQPMTPAHFDALQQDLTASLAGADLFVQERSAGAEPRYRIPVRVITELAWHSLFARNLFLDASPSSALGSPDGFTIISAPSFQADPARHGTRSNVVIAINFTRRLVLIGGTRYAGEIKKAVFTAMNFALPAQGVLSMHCSANRAAAGDVALFFGLSGTGKTTLSSDPERRLIGDDEHGWSDDGVFNIEGGCYAKVIRLSPAAEPQIFATTRRSGTVLENVVVDQVTGRMNLDDDRHTENTRAAYPISFIDNAEPAGRGGHPANVVMLTADAFGVLPPIARLSADGAMYHFLSGYTARLAGTERGVTAPKAVFSACFGAPFLPLPPSRYAALLGEKIARHKTRVWLVNTGWTGGPYGVGQRMPIADTRAMIAAALSGRLDGVPCTRDERFNLEVPTTVPGVAPSALVPRMSWQNPTDYDAQAAALARMFVDNFATVGASAAPSVGAAGPRVS